MVSIAMIIQLIIPLLHLISSGIGDLSPIYVANSSECIEQSICIVDGKPLHPCVIPQMLTTNGLTKNDSISVYLIHQNYVIDTNISLRFNSLTSLILQPWKNGKVISILCIGDLSISISEIEGVLIQSIQFTDCGKHNHLLRIENSLFISISQAAFIGTVKCSIMLHCETSAILYVHNSIFKGGMQSHNYSIYIHSVNHTIESKLSDTKFISNNAGAVYFNVYGSLQFESCVFANNKNSLRKGSAIFIFNSRIVIINNSTFYRNSNTCIVNAQSTWQAILLVNNSNFTENTGHNGGVLYIPHSSQLLFYNSKFTSNNAIKSGGVISGCTEGEGNNKAWKIAIINCIFKTNFALISGGVFSIKACTTVDIKIYNSTLMENTATGGVFYTIETDLFVLTMSNTSIRSNDGHLSGGAIYAITTKTILLRGGTFHNNTATLGGAIHVLVAELFEINEGNFFNNVASEGGAIKVAGTKIFKIQEAILNANSATTEGGAMKFNSIGSIETSVCHFSNNKAFHSGGAIAVKNEGYIKMTKSFFLFSCDFVGNQAKKGGSIFLNNVFSTINKCNVSNSNASSGGGLYAEDSTIYISNIISYNNSATYSGGSLTVVSSHVNFMFDSEFILDRVTSSGGIGGAIYIQDSVNYCHKDSCLLSWTQHSRISFINTSAPTGPMIFGGMLDRCYAIQGSNPLKSIKFNDMKYDINSYGITSIPSQICDCENKTQECQSRSASRNVIPGKMFYVEVMCIDQLQQIIPCDVRGEYQHKEVMLGQGQNLRRIQSCQKIAFTAFVENINVSMLVLMAGLCGNHKENALMFKLQILSCPEGFENINKKCQCDQRLKELFKEVECSVESGSITFNEGWLGYDGEYFRACKICPQSYCNLNESKAGLVLSTLDKQCNYNRSRILCGQCISNYSVILGSWQCRHCSNTNLGWLLVLMVLAGVGLVLFLLLTKLTVSSGTINGLILYSNIISFSGLLDQHSSSIHPVLRAILSWINLDLGINVCFYSGMDVYQKTWLQFVFPFYIWFLVGIIIIFCHYSPKIMKLMGMRNIEIMATLFLLSYTKILKTISTVLSATTITVADSRNASNSFSSKKVWVYDGNIEYLGSKHLPLFMVALIFLLFLFLPYTLLLIFGQCLRSLPRRKGLQWFNNTTITSVLDAYHAPYNQHHRYWTGLGLMFRCCLFTIFSTSYSIQKNLFWTTIGLIIFLCYRQVFCSKIYNNKFSDLLELFYLMNMAILSATLSYSSSKYPFIISVALALVAFFVTFIYHVILEVRSHLVFCKLSEHSFISFKKFKNSSTPKKEDATSSNPSNTSTFVELRESLLDN